MKTLIIGVEVKLGSPPDNENQKLQYNLYHSAKWHQQQPECLNKLLEHC